MKRRLTTPSPDARLLKTGVLPGVAAYLCVAAPSRRCDGTIGGLHAIPARNISLQCLLIRIVPLYFLGYTAAPPLHWA